MEGVDGEESEGEVTSKQPHPPSPMNVKGEESEDVRHGRSVRDEKSEGVRHGRSVRGEKSEELEALEAAEQQMILIHDEYKKLLREKEVCRQTLYMHPHTHIQGEIVHACMSVPLSMYTYIINYCLIVWIIKGHRCIGYLM